MSQASTGIVLNGASSQYERWIRSAEADSVKVDSRTFSELLSFAVQFGGLVNFFDLGDHVEGDWSLFFLTDPTIILASIDAINLRDIEQRISARLRAARKGPSHEDGEDPIVECTRSLVAMARQCDEWLGAALHHPESRTARLFSGEVAAAIDRSLAPNLAHLKEISKRSRGSERNTAGEIDFDGFSSLWTAKSGEVFKPRHAESSRHRKNDEIASQLEAILEVFLGAFGDLQTFARQQLPATLEESNHKPQIGLYIAFVKLFEIAQRTLNTLTARFSDFYYRDILREHKASPVPDHVYLTFTLDPATGANFSSVPAATEFPAGQEADGSAILYAADKAVTVSAATLASLRSLRLVTGPVYEASPPWDPGSPPAGPALQRVLSTAINLKLMNDEAAGKGPATGPIPWATFGNTSSTQDTDIAVTTPVTLGLAIGSQYLMLTGGDRTVTVEFRISGGFPAAMKADLDTLANATGLDSDSVFDQIAEAAFDIWLSNTSGWFQLDAYSCSTSPSSFSLTFLLPASAPPVEPYNPASGDPPPKQPGPDSINPRPDLPTLKAYLRQEQTTVAGLYGSVEVYPLTLLAQVGIDSILISTETLNMKSLTVSNSAGPLDISTPFPVFGGAAVAGSYLQFGNEELFVKQPDSGSLTIDLLWYGLPQNDNGFTGYYQGYVLGVDGVPPPDPPLFDNQSFQGDIRVINPGSWTFTAETSPPLVESPPSPPDSVGVFLFRASDGNPTDCACPIPSSDGTLCLNSEFSSLPIVPAETPSYYDPSASAIRLTLTAPPYAFGNVLYAPNVLNAAIEELPKPTPWPPVAEAAVADEKEDLTNSLQSLLSSVSAAAPAKSAVQTEVQRLQNELVNAAHSHLSNSLKSEGASVSSWISQVFASGASKPAPYQASTVGKVLASAIQAIAAGVPLGSLPVLPAGAAGVFREAKDILDGVIALQQALDRSAAEPDGSFLQSIRTHLSAAMGKLRQTIINRGSSSRSVSSPAFSGTSSSGTSSSGTSWLAAPTLLESPPDPSPPEPDSTAVYPNPPWLPQAEALSIGYRAHCSFSPASAGSDSENYFCLLLPFGGYLAGDEISPIPLLPVPAQSSLELGFTGLNIAQSLNLLVQTAAGMPPDSPPVEWQYLEGNDVVELTAAQVPLDTTNQLQNTGILTLTLPQATAAPQTVSTDDYRWLSASTANPDDFPDLIGIYPNPGTATWVSAAVDGQTGSGQHLDKPLPAYTIKSAVENLPSVKTICQPIESFGGIPAETPVTFQTRMAERLRHKDRAVLPWDYEQLVLENFPTIWKVQTLPATSTTSLNSPGNVLMVVVAGPQSVQVADPTEPLVSAEMLQQIHGVLASRATPFATIQVINPPYVRITVTAQVMFGGTDNGGGGIDELNSELVQYLSPWFYDAERASLRGTYASEDAISRFIETRPYVSALIQISFAYDPLPQSLDWYFLTSAKSHIISEVVEQGGKDPCKRS